MRSKYTYPMILASIVLGLDLVTKLWVESSGLRFEAMPVIPGFFDLVFVLNKGAAFGFLGDQSIDWQRPFFICTSLLACGVILYLLKIGYGREPLASTGLGLLLGGAVGNLIDRIRIGYVVDFLDFHYDGWHWPAFNVADIGISCGVTILLISFYITERRTRRTGTRHEREDS
ncbi:signal peptidase II [Desulfovibrio ferrophilus]|uniref:Lipoprotein signal peptidase n=1 Tax=Desulfovibrio ferrophilus TaxID=241368 RepID=A0A2Z6AX05_9BACT|nr:signal peptidase II [Desulfovibrio ferrophilus]BBD07750.1 lipoprotein signal peptidase [Desulfovibrio ferrophilus]